MSNRRGILRRGGAVLAALVATAALVTFIVDYSGTKNALALARTELEKETERNRRAFELLLQETSKGRIGPAELARYLSDADVSAIVEKAGLAVKASLPFQLDTQFYPSGWMGDGEYGTKYLRFTRKTSEAESGVFIEVEYTAGPTGWAGIYWLYPGKNWGDVPGKSLVGARAVTFRAKGAQGGELVEFKSGGVQGKKYGDSYERSLGVVPLSRDWQEYRIDLAGADLSSVIGAFAWSASAGDNPGAVHFFIADLMVR